MSRRIQGAGLVVLRGPGNNAQNVELGQLRQPYNSIQKESELFKREQVHSQQDLTSDLVLDTNISKKMLIRMVIGQCTENRKVESRGKCWQCLSEYYPR